MKLIAIILLTVLSFDTYAQIRRRRRPTPPPRRIPRRIPRPIPRPYPRPTPYCSHYDYSATQREARRECDRAVRSFELKHNLNCAIPTYHFDYCQSFCRDHHYNDSSANITVVLDSDCRFRNSRHVRTQVQWN